MARMEDQLPRRSDRISSLAQYSSGPDEKEYLQPRPQRLAPQPRRRRPRRSGERPRRGDVAMDRLAREGARPALLRRDRLRWRKSRLGEWQETRAARAARPTERNRRRQWRGAHGHRRKPARWNEIARRV